jgi:hypothetical protein
MAIERPFRLSRGARGVAERGGAPLIEFGPLEIPVLGLCQLLVGGECRQSSQRLGIVPGQQNDAAVFGELRCQPLDQRNEGAIDEKKPVLGMVDDVDDLLVEQPRIDRMANGSDARDTVIELEMPKGDRRSAAA